MKVYIKDYEKYFKDVYDRNIDTIYKVCFIYLRGNKTNAEDAVQTTFLNMFKKKIVFENESHEKGWLITVATNTCKNLLKSKWNKNISIDELELVIPDSEEKNKEMCTVAKIVPNQEEQVEEGELVE